MSLQTIIGHARQQPSKPAMIYQDNVVSYAAFASASAGTAQFLETQRLHEGDTAIVLVYNLLDCWVTVLALQYLGLHTVCVNSVADLDTLNLAHAAALVTTRREAPKELLEPGVVTPVPILAIPNPNYDCDELAAPCSEGARPSTGGHILYTSGTTGNYKKLFMQADLQRQRNAERIQSMPNCSADAVYHCLGFGLWTAAGYKNAPAIWQAGGCIVLDQRTDWPQHFLRSGLTHTTLIPDQVQLLLDSLGDQAATSPLANFHLIVTSGFLSRSCAEQVVARITPHLENAFGSTESCILTLRSKVNNLDDLHWLAPSPLRVIEIVDEHHNICPVDVEGQLRIRQTELDSMAYMDNPEASGNVFHGGYFYPGDLAVQRADGRICIHGRSADVLNLQGQKVAVAPMEQMLQQRLKVQTVCLFSGMSVSGEVEVVIALESKDAPPDAQLQRLGEEFGKYGQVRLALFERFPRTKTGTSKIDRIALRKLIFYGN